MKSLDSLEFDDDFVSNNDVHPIPAIQPHGLVDYRQGDLPKKGNVILLEFIAEAFLICRFQQPRTECAMHFDRKPDDFLGQWIAFQDLNHSKPRERAAILLCASVSLWFICFFPSAR